MKQKINQKEFVLALIILLTLVVLLALSMFFTWYAEQFRRQSEKISTIVIETDISSSLTRRLVWEEGPDYKRMQTSFRDSNAFISYENESIYAEVRE